MSPLNQIQDVQLPLSLQELGEKVTNQDKPDQKNYSHYKKKHEQIREQLIKKLSEVPGFIAKESDLTETREPCLFNFDTLLPRIFNLRNIDNLKDQLVEKGFGLLISNQAKAVIKFVESLKDLANELEIRDQSMFRLNTEGENKNSIFYGENPENGAVVYQVNNEGSFTNKLLVKVLGENLTVRLQGSSPSFIIYKAKLEQPAKGSFEIKRDEESSETATQRAARTMHQNGDTGLKIVVPVTE